MSLVDKWIVYCADPVGSHTVPPHDLPPQLAGRLVDQAESHRVLGAVLQNFPGFRQDGPFAAHWKSARDRNRANVAFSLMLTHEADTLVEKLDGLRATVVKGPTFAKKLYPSPTLRTFSDIDVLIDVDDQVEVERILKGLGYHLAEASQHEFKWLSGANEQVMVEVQTDLVHAESLRRGMSLSYGSIAQSPDSSASLLIIAVVHGAGHQYEYLQHLVDICQAARFLKPTDEAELDRLLAATNARFATLVSLLFAGRIFGEDRCNVLAREIGSTPLHKLAASLLDQTVIMSTTDQRRASYNWRRQAFRLLLRNS
ncbi:MAG: nucleotidyltransferase family protein [Beijerinckiaceae bacterium]|nr:nucleotidyltransferase family protein [Beijerinckiaceae bacterium]